MTDSKPADVQATPMMAQYLEIKAANLDCLLFYRMGDFFEMFFEDAERASQAIGITLTTRGTHMGKPIPMCGVPVRTADDYLQKLIRAGFKIAVCEQVEDPREAKKRGGKAVVRRDVVRLVTPGTLTEENLLDAASNNFLTALYFGATGSAHMSAKDGATATGCMSAGGRVALAAMDISTGDFEIGEVAASDLAGELIRLSPREILVSDGLSRETRAEVLRIAGMMRAAVNDAPAITFDARSGEAELKKRFRVDALDAFGAFSKLEFSATAALMRYVELTQIGRFPQLRPPRRRGPSGGMVIDAATRINLELLSSLKGERAVSLLGAMDRTLTGAGSRELAARIAGPLAETREIDARLDAVAFLVEDTRLRADLRTFLRQTPDMARAVARLSVGRGGPRDLGTVRAALAEALAIAVRLDEGLGLPLLLTGIRDRLRGLDAGLADLLASALVDDLPYIAREGGFVRDGFRPALDEMKRLRDTSRQVLAALQARYADETGIRSLKVRHNNIIGYFIEVSAGNADKLLQPPLSAQFQHRQTMAGAVRFSTVELTEAEEKITTAGERALAIELDIFDELARAVLAAGREIGEAAAALAELDVHAGLAELAEEQGLTRPIVDASLAFHIIGGRHPVVEQALKKTGAGPFIENDCVLEDAVSLSLTPAGDAGGSAGARESSDGLPPDGYLRPDARRRPVGLASLRWEKGDDPSRAQTRTQIAEGGSAHKNSEGGSADTRSSSEREVASGSASRAQVAEGDSANKKRGRLWVVTGPNMAGKSTFLRQNALIAVMAQAGSFVPALRAHIGVVDRLFSRVGASDDLARGRSTFMVEMVETAAILNQAGERSLVILDEIGRGTATFDGLSIAWATIEHLHEVNRCRALFATHYHELTALTERLARAANVTVQVREWQHDIIFLHKVTFGVADRSYGIQVARLAGLPEAVIKRAGEVLAELEKAQGRRKPEDLLDELPLFAAARPKSVLKQPAASAQPVPSPLEAALAALQPDDLTPREALEALYRLKGKLKTR
jgi:DNA mismatch repair protein MutS